MISNCWPLMASATLSTTDPLDNRNETEEHGVVLEPTDIDESFVDPL